MSSDQRSRIYSTLGVSLAITAISASLALSGSCWFGCVHGWTRPLIFVFFFLGVFWWNKKSRGLKSRIRELEAELNSSVEKCAAERQGRVRAQQALREAVARPLAEDFHGNSYPMSSIGVVKSCFSVRNGTPRWPLLVQLARACLIFDASQLCSGLVFHALQSEPSLRGLKNILRLHINKVNCSEWEMISVPSTTVFSTGSVRAIVALNLHNYCSARNPWGHLKPDYLEKRGFLEAHMDDGLLEIFGLKQGCHASFVMVDLISAKHIAQALAIQLEVRGGEWKNAYRQMDGEPWKQPLSQDYSTFVEIKRVPFQLRMIRGE